MLILDFDQLEYIPHPNGVTKYFLIPQDKQENIWEDIGHLNHLLHRTSAQAPCIDTENLYIDSINFDASVKIIDGGQHTFAFKTPNTKSGKNPKYPVMVHFGEHLNGKHSWEVNQNTFGEIYYLKSGGIGKARAIFWRDYHCYVAEFRSTKSEELYLWRVHTKLWDNSTAILFENALK